MKIESVPEQKTFLVVFKAGKLFDLPWFWYTVIALTIVVVRALGNPIQLGLPFISDDLRYFFLAKTTPPFYIFTACIQFFFRPVVHSLYWLLFHSIGTNFVGVHLTLIVLHAGLAVLVAAFFRRLTKAPILLVAPVVIFWGVFGGYDEVFYFTSSFATELMGAWFTVLSLLFFLRHLDDEGPFWMVPICLIFAYGSKESSIVILPLMALLCLWRRKLPHRWIIKLIILLIPTLAYLVLEYYLQVVVSQSFRKSNLKFYYLGWHIFRNFGQMLVIVSGGSIWLNLSWIWRGILAVLLFSLTIWLGRREGLIAFLMLLVMILPFGIKTTVLVENDTRHIYMPAMLWGLLLLTASNRLVSHWGKQGIIAVVLWIFAVANMASGIIWVNLRYQHYQYEISFIEVILCQVNPELEQTQRSIPLWGYNLFDPGLLPILNAVYFNDRLIDLSGLTPEEAAQKAAELGYDPPRALSWEKSDDGSMNGKNLWRTLPQGEVFQGK